MAAPRILVEIAASLGRFEADFGKATKIVQQNSRQISSAISTVKGLLAGLGITLSASAFVGLIKGTIDAADHLNDLSQSTGIAVETLGGLGFAASQSGSSLDDAASSFGKLNLKIAAAIAGNQEAVKAFNAVGISIAELKSLSPDQIFARLADRFREYEDGANKAALGQAFFGKSYQGTIPLLNEGGEKLRQNIDYYKRYSGVTEELTKQSDEFNDTLVKLRLLGGAFAKNLTAELLPSLQALTEEMVKAKEQGDGFRGTASDIADVLKGTASVAAFVAAKVSGIGHELGFLAAASTAILRGELGLVSKIIDEAAADQEARQARLDRILDAINNPPSPTIRNAAGVGSPRGTKPAPSLGSGDVDDTLRKVLEGQIKAFEAAVKEEQDILKDRQHFLDAYYQDDQIGIREYFAARQAVIDDALKAELAALDGEIAALREYAAKTANPKERVDAENQIAEAIRKRAKVQRDAAVAGIDNFLQEGKAARDFKRSIEDIALALAQINGDSILAASLAFDLQYKKQQDLINLQKDSDDAETRRLAVIGQSRLDELRKRNAQQSILNKTQSDFGDIVDAIGIRQARIDLAQQAGSITELNALQAKSVAAKDYIARLSELAAAAEKTALETGLLKDANAAAQLRLELDKLVAQGDIFAKSFRDIFEHSFADAFTDLLDGTKSAKDAFKDMTRSILHDINQIVAKQLANQLFGTGSGAGGAIGGFFSWLFGGNSWPTGANGIPGAASGGSFPAGPLWVGERGPELIMPTVPSTVIPNNVVRLFGRSSDASRGPTIVQNINVLPGATRQTAGQAASSVYLAVLKAQRNI